MTRKRKAPQRKIEFPLTTLTAQEARDCWEAVSQMVEDYRDWADDELSTEEKQLRDRLFALETRFHGILGR